jgi:hypothetical protein
MESPIPRWSLLGTFTNSHGVKFFSLACRDVMNADGDYEELTELLRKVFHAEETGELVGPYSVHKYFKVESFCLGLILDSPDWLDLYAKDARDTSLAESFVAKILRALNAKDGLSTTATDT